MERAAKRRLPSAYAVSNWVDDDVLVGNAPYDATSFDAILSMGVTRFVCLCSWNELHFDYIEHLTDEHAIHYEPIRDRHVAPDSRAVFIAQWIIDQTTAGNRVYVHCLGGIGRAGTIASLYLGLRHGYDAEDAMRAVNESRQTRRFLNHPKIFSPESDCQRDQVRRILKAENEYNWGSHT
jgi:hypothetical protein